MQETNSPLTFAIVDTINTIPQKDWERLSPKDTIENYGYHKTLEESASKNFQYFTLRQNETMP